MTAARKIALPVRLPREIAIEWGLIDSDAAPEPEQTPEEKALAILAPHLADAPLYRP